MPENKDFIIQIKGLQIGKHEYDFPIDGSFFRNFENSQILDADLDAEVLLEKGSGWMNVEADITGYVTVECDRCLEDVEIPSSSLWILQTESLTLHSSCMTMYA